LNKRDTFKAEEDIMPDKILDKEEKAAKKLLKKYPFIKDMWEEREKVFLK